MSERTICITEYDLQRLKELLEEAKHSQYRGSEYLLRLQAELDRAEVVAPQEVPQTVITMNSTVSLIDLDTGAEETYSLVFPEEADIQQGKLSILAPIGTALLGYQVGDTIEWKVPAGTRRLQVKEILYQPESSGDYHL